MIRKVQVKQEEILIARPLDPVPPNGQVILFEQFGLLRRSWWRVLLIAMVVTAATAYYVFAVMPVEFRSTVIAVPPNKAGTPLDNLIGTATSSLRDIGFKSLIGSKGSSSAGYSNLAVLSSQAIYDSLIAKYDLFEVYGIPRQRVDQVYDLLDDHVKVNVDEEGPISVDVYDVDAKRAAAMANDIVRFTNALSRDLNRRETEPLTRFVGERYTKVREEQERLGARLQSFMQRTNLYDPESQSRVVSAAVMDAQTTEAAQQAMVDLYTTALGANDPRTIQARDLLDGYRKRLGAMATGKSGAITSFNIQTLPSSTVEYLKLRQDYETNAKVMALLEPLYEQTKFDEIRDIPILNVLHAAVPSPVKARPKRSIIVLSAFVGTLVFTYIIIAAVVYGRGFMRRYRHYASGVGMISQWESPTNGDTHS